MLDLYDCPIEPLNDLAFLEEAVLKATSKSHNTLLNSMAHSFSPHGVTVIALLAESHVSLHTWPEYGYAAADVFTCGLRAKPEEACLYLIKRLGSQRFSLHSYSRGTDLQGRGHVADHGRRT